MARINTANPLTNNAPQRKKGLKEQIDSHLKNSEVRLISTGAEFLRDRPSTQSRSSSQRQSRGSGAVFDILADGDFALQNGKAELEQETSSSPRKQNRSRALTATNLNSLLLPLQPHQRQRPSIKVETDDYEKENDIADNWSEVDAATMASTTQRSTMRRNMPRTPRNRRARTPLSQRGLESEQEDSCGDNSFNSLDDFIVSDNEDLSFHGTSGSDTDGEHAKEPTPPPPPPSTRRRLLRGRRPGFDVGSKTSVEAPWNTPLQLDPKVPDAVKLPSSKNSPKHLFQDDFEVPTRLRKLDLDNTSEPVPQFCASPTSSTIDLEDLPTGPQPMERKLKTPPASPSRNRLRSPTKKKIRIPPTPHRESSDAFWSQGDTFDWIDEHSPRKETSPKRTVIELLQDFDDSENEGSSRDSGTSSEPDPMSQVRHKTPKTLSKTALKRMEAEKKRAAKARRLSFDNKKAEFALTFLGVLDEAVAGSQVTRLAEPTGGVKIVWSKTLQKTAGRAQWKGERQVSRSIDGRPEGPRKIRHHATIELAERIIVDEYRLINTLAHEYCHLANYMVSNVHDNPHGASFKQWGKKCEEALKDHPLYGGQLHVTTKHTYKIDYKYVWSCNGCGLEYGRHSKSITSNHRCGNSTCRGTLEQIKPKPRNVSPKKNTTPGTKVVLEEVSIDLEKLTL
ncbi:hypothetical protein N7462_007945 [Penicillium macrosclerotiorum]|uniref:uncharacterized protein n=1 Tax=Penicillium macrosclerotiorum TaxID=303699 RepID=UPI0025488130|nr:uncharacterized protein N7462_007945 [Penicillium macrosclerotiorum]KAJ5679701.1 hypothetical protein N7462_007945 [Penicillium macrosclerotiorum]